MKRILAALMLMVIPICAVYALVVCSVVAVARLMAMLYGGCLDVVEEIAEEMPPSGS